MTDLDTAPASQLGLTAETLDRWPGKERREPPVSDRHYLVLSSLAEEIRAALETRFADARGSLRVLDLGCGAKPYLPLVASRAASYRGLDVAAGPLVDDVGVAERLPYADESFDLVLCTQMLEHVDEPAAVVREIHRVLAPGGVALVSTHGVALYHPAPESDYWRWTHTGLARLIGGCGEWDSVEIVPNRNFVACIGYLVVQFVDEAVGRMAPDTVRRAVTSSINRAARRLDRRYPPRARVPRPGSLSANYLAICTKAA